MSFPLTVIAGPTASGKTALALRLASQKLAEIVGADSQQVYRYFDIGTAKPSAAELAQVPHHLVSMVDPLEGFSGARYQALADAAIEDLHARGKRVIVVGGTGMYLRMLLRGVVAAPPASPELRAQLEARAEREGRSQLHRELAEVDPVTASWVQPNDLVRIIRALEIHQLTGQTASSWREAHRFAIERHPHRLFVLNPPREELYSAIDARARLLFEGGLIEEVRGLVEKGYRDAPPMGSVGYVQALAVLEGRMDLSEAIAQTAKLTRHYAKRQLTWFRKEPTARFVWPPDRVGWDST